MEFAWSFANQRENPNAGRLTGNDEIRQQASTVGKPSRRQPCGVQCCSFGRQSKRAHLSSFKQLDVQANLVGIGQVLAIERKRRGPHSVSGGVGGQLPLRHHRLAGRSAVKHKAPCNSQSQEDRGSSTGAEPEVAAKRRRFWSCRGGPRWNGTGDRNARSSPGRRLP